MEAVGGNPPSLSFYRSLWSGDIVNMEHICHEFLKKVLEKAKKKNLLTQQSTFGILSWFVPACVRGDMGT